MIEAEQHRNHTRTLPSSRLYALTLRIRRFSPASDGGLAHSSSPFSKSGSSLHRSSPFGQSGSANRRQRGKRWTQDYQLMVHPEDNLLDCLLTIKRTMDPTLAFRYSCGHGMCGSDAVCINHRPTLLCKAKVRQWSVRKQPVSSPDITMGFRHTKAVQDVPLFAQPTESFSSAHRAELMDEPGSARDPALGDDANLGVIEIAPLPGFPVVRDLIADIDPMLEEIIKLKPYLRADGELASTDEGKVDVFEYLQMPQDLSQYELLSNCIACGICEGSCPVYSGGDPFIGPTALIVTSRFINDSRDRTQVSRLKAIDTDDGVAACQSVRACSRQCPQGIDVGEEIWQLVTRIRENKKNSSPFVTDVA